MPMVQHGPWVREGTSGGIMIGATHTNDINTDGDIPRTFVAFDGGIRKGFVPDDSTKAAFAIGSQTSIWAIALMTSAEDWENALGWISLDAYATPQLSRRYATSAGATVSLNHVLPYVQIGSKKPENGWYTTQSLLFVRDGNTFLWLPSVTKYDSDRRPRATHFTIGAGIGSRSDQALYMLMVSVYMEFFERRRVR